MLSRHRLLEHFSLCGVSLLLYAHAALGVGSQQSGTPSATQKDVYTPTHKHIHQEPQKQISAQSPKQEQPTSSQTNSVPASATVSEPRPSVEDRINRVPHTRLSVSATSETMFSSQMPSITMHSTDNSDDSLRARSLWLPTNSFGFSQLTNLRLSEQLEGDLSSEHSLSMTATTHFIQPVIPINTGNNTISLKPSFVTALSLDGKWKQLTGSLSVWNDTGLLSTFFDASIGYKFKVGAFDFGTKLFISDNLTSHLLNGVFTAEAGQKIPIPGLHLSWHIAANIIDAPVWQNMGSNIEIGLQGEWDSKLHLNYNLAFQQPFRDEGKNRQFAVNVGFKF